MTFVFPDREVSCKETTDAKIGRMLERADISVIGNNNSVRLRFDSETSAEELLTGGGFLLIVKGDGNSVEMGNVIVRYSTILGMTGLKLIIGQLPGLGAGVSRTANECKVTIGDRVVINGVMLYLQEDNSWVSIGDDSQLSWGCGRVVHGRAYHYRPGGHPRQLRGEHRDRAARMDRKGCQDRQEHAYRGQ